jgi:hypothetical protein
VVKRLENAPFLDLEWATAWSRLDRARASSTPQERAPKRQVEAHAAGQRVIALAQRVDAMEVQAGRAAPDNDVSMFDA